MEETKLMSQKNYKERIDENVSEQETRKEMGERESEH